jgi:hypothetical protein
MDLVVQHTMEACFAPPEYGGNRRGGGWQLAGLEGDSQPLGFSIFSRADGTYHERPDHPMSTPNPDDPGVISADGERIQDGIVLLTGLADTPEC